METNKTNNCHCLKYKNQWNILTLLSVVVVTLSLFVEYIGNWFLYLVVATAMVGSVDFTCKIINKRRLKLFDILGFAFLLIYVFCVVITPWFDSMFFFFECALIISMVVCMACCKEEDAKAIAILHVIYLFGCNLVMPCIGPSI